MDVVLTKKELTQSRSTGTMPQIQQQLKRLQQMMRARCNLGDVSVNEYFSEPSLQDLQPIVQPKQEESIDNLLSKEIPQIVKTRQVQEDGSASIYRMEVSSKFLQSSQQVILKTNSSLQDPTETRLSHQLKNLESPGQNSSTELSLQTTQAVKQVVSEVSKEVSPNKSSLRPHGQDLQLVICPQVQGEILIKETQVETRAQITQQLKKLQQMVTARQTREESSQTLSQQQQQPPGDEQIWRENFVHSSRYKVDGSSTDVVTPTFSAINTDNNYSNAATNPLVSTSTVSNLSDSDATVINSGHPNTTAINLNFASITNVRHSNVSTESTTISSLTSSLLSTLASRSTSPQSNDFQYSASQLSSLLSAVNSINLNSTSPNGNLLIASSPVSDQNFKSVSRRSGVFEHDQDLQKPKLSISKFIDSSLNPSQSAPPSIYQLESQAQVQERARMASQEKAKASFEAKMKARARAKMRLETQETTKIHSGPKTRNNQCVKEENNGCIEGDKEGKGGGEIGCENEKNNNLCTGLKRKTSDPKLGVLAKKPRLARTIPMLLPSPICDYRDESGSENESSSFRPREQLGGSYLNGLEIDETKLSQLGQQLHFLKHGHQQELQQQQVLKSKGTLVERIDKRKEKLLHEMPSTKKSHQIQEKLDHEQKQNHVEKLKKVLPSQLTTSNILNPKTHNEFELPSSANTPLMYTKLLPPHQTKSISPSNSTHTLTSTAIILPTTITTTTKKRATTMGIASPPTALTDRVVQKTASKSNTKIKTFQTLPPIPTTTTTNTFIKQPSIATTIAKTTPNMMANTTANKISNTTPYMITNTSANKVSNPTVNPTANTMSNPTANPTSNKMSNPTANPTANMMVNTSANKVSNPTTNPTSNKMVRVNMMAKTVANKKPNVTANIKGSYAAIKFDLSSPLLIEFRNELHSLSLSNTLSPIVEPKGTRPKIDLSFRQKWANHFFKEYRKLFSRNQRLAVMTTLMVEGEIYRLTNNTAEYRALSIQKYKLLCSRLTQQ
eukprot:TRINITY_DN9009_c0_g1_i1.p1 TRINITY_DN9009_c0_g1~~TRINITY_DN9009_c0_g1_i1.p1  ORF type:complete len:1048 (-),score=222.94 TRINITY_DN9009_c0_g1_i1:111-3152(-)